MKKLAILLSFTASLALANSVDEIVKSAYENNQDLKSLQKAIDTASYNITLSKKWKDPVLTFGVNDIHFDEPLKRDKEPMQAQYVGFSQIIPVGKKLDIQEDIAKKDKSIASLLLEDKKLKLKSKIYEASYNILMLEQKMKLLNSYERNIKKLKKLSNDLYKFGKSNQNEVLNADISLVNLEIQKQNLQNMIDNSYLKLEQITYKKVDNISNSVDINKLVLHMDVNSHPKVKMQELKSKKFLDVARLEKENERSDIKLNVAYFNRDSKYEDYANISVNIPLSIYKTQKVKALRARSRANEVSSKIQDLKQSLQTQVKVLQNNANVAYKNYTLIQKRVIPLKRKIQKNIENYNSFSQIKPQMAIRNLNELISYELKAIDEKIKYFSNYSQTKYYETRVK